MKLLPAAKSDQNQFTAYGDGYVMVNHQRYEQSIVVTPEIIHQAWSVTGIDTLSADALDFLLSLKPEILLLGTGATHQFPGPAVLRKFVHAQIGVETMGTPAACRTFNILMAEGRNVIAAIIV